VGFCFFKWYWGFGFFCFLFWLIAFQYPGGNVFLYHRVYGFVAVLLGFGLFLFFRGVQSFYSFYSISKDLHSSESPQAQVLRRYVRCLLDTDYFYIGVLNVGNFYATLQYVLPMSQVVDYKTFEAYLTDFNLKMLSIVKTDAEFLSVSECGFKVLNVKTSVTPNNFVSHGIVEKLSMAVNLYVDSSNLFVLRAKTSLC